MSLYTYRQAAAVPLRQQVAGSGSSSSSVGQKLALTVTAWDFEPHFVVVVAQTE
jgi:hypothetical protein